MTEQPSPPPTPPLDRRDIRNLRRSSSDRVIAGVCGGLGRYTGVDPVVFRITLAVLAVFGGAGLLLYAIAWLLIPDDAAAQSEAQRLVRGRGTLFTLFAFGIGLLGVLALGAVVGRGWPGPFPAIILAAAIGALIIYRHGYGEPAPTPQQRPGGAPLGPPPGYTANFSETPRATYTAPIYEEPLGGDEPWVVAPPPPPAPRPRRPPSFLAPIGASLGLLVAGVVLALGAAGAFDITAQAVFAAALLTVGLVLIAGAWFGRSPGLIAVGALLTVGLVIAAAVNVPLRGGIGNRGDSPLTLSEVAPSYHLGIGQENLDLSGLRLDGATRHIDATVGLGNLDVVVPPNVKVVVRARSGTGQLRLLDQRYTGTQLDRRLTIDAVGEQAGELDLDLRVGVGEVEIWQTADLPAVPAPSAPTSPAVPSPPQGAQS